MYAGSIGAWPASGTGHVAVEVRHELLDASNVLGEEGPRVPGLDLGLAAGVANDANEGLGVEPRASSDLPAQLDCVARGRLAMETHRRPEEDHDRTLAGLEELELPPAVPAGREHALPQMQ